MRVAYAVLPCLLATAGDAAPALRQTIQTAQSVTSAARTLPPSVPGGAQQAAPPASATSALRCIQDALGGTRAFDAVSSVRFTSNTRPTATTRPRPIPTRMEMGVVFPDRYKLQTVETDPRPGSPPLTGLLGFSGGVLLSNPWAPVPAAAVPKVMPRVRQDYVRQVLMRLPRELPGVRLSTRTVPDGGQERLAVDAFSPGLVATLLAEVRTCVPVALQYTAASMAEGKDTYRVELSDYRPFGGIRFPTLLKKARNGEPWEDEYDVKVEVNASFEDGYFRE